MSVHLTTFEGSVTDAIREAIEGALEGAAVEVSGGGGHFHIAVTSALFAGKSTLERHRMVLRAVAPLMAGESAPVHAVDSLRTVTP